MNTKLLVLAAALAASAPTSLPAFPTLPKIPTSPIPGMPSRLPHPTIPGLDVIPAQLPSRQTPIPGGFQLGRDKASAAASLEALRSALDSRMPAAASLGAAFDRAR